jgi:hypothetical protein
MVMAIRCDGDSVGVNFRVGDLVTELAADRLCDGTLRGRPTNRFIGVVLLDLERYDVGYMMRSFLSNVRVFISWDEKRPAKLLNLAGFQGYPK